MDQYAYSIFGSSAEKSLKHRLKTPNKFLCLVILVLALGVTLTILNLYELHRMREDYEIHHINIAVPVVEGNLDSPKSSDRPIVWIEGRHVNSGYLNHVFHVFQRIGYNIGKEYSDWDILWSHDYPFASLSGHLKNLKPYQKVNHFPGSGYITSKSSLATSQMKFIPKAFKLPDQKDAFLAFSIDHPHKMWVQKSNTHRGIEIKGTSELNLTQEGSFLQEYIDKPFLIDGHKFDIGIYTILSSINPLRVYIIEGETLFRFCPEVYYPFSAKKKDKYVVHDDYLPLWKLPSLKDVYLNYGYSFRHTFNHYIRSKGLNYEKVWSDIKQAIITVYQEKEPQMIESAASFKTTHHFFEMVRFDFVLDEDLNVYLMEANMSPNLSTSHFPPNKRLYEHVIFNLLGLIGAADYVSHQQLDFEEDMRVSSVDIHVFPEICTENKCQEGCFKSECKLCRQCLSKQTARHLKRAYLEHTRRGSCRRIFPPSINHTQALNWNPETPWPEMENVSDRNKLLYTWFIGMCRLDKTWC